MRLNLRQQKLDGQDVDVTGDAKVVARVKYRFVRRGSLPGEVTFEESCPAMDCCDGKSFQFVLQQIASSCRSTWLVLNYEC